MELSWFWNSISQFSSPTKTALLAPLPSFNWKNKRQRLRVDIRNRNEIRNSKSNNINNDRYYLHWKPNNTDWLFPTMLSPMRRKPFSSEVRVPFSAPSNDVRLYQIILGYWPCPLSLICAKSRIGTKSNILLSCRKVLLYCRKVKYLWEGT